jgi:DNA polymerase-4
VCHRRGRSGARPAEFCGWRPGDDVVHEEFGTGWVQGAGHGGVSVRFETRSSGPGVARTFAQADPQLSRGDPADCLK